MSDRAASPKKKPDRKKRKPKPINTKATDNGRPAATPVVERPFTSPTFGNLYVAWSHSERHCARLTVLWPTIRRYCRRLWGDAVFARVDASAVFDGADPVPALERLSDLIHCRVTPEEVVNIPLSNVVRWLAEEAGIPLDNDGHMAARPNCGHLLGPLQLKEWGALLRVHWKTVRRRIAAGVYRHEQQTRTAYRLAAEDLPEHVCQELGNRCRGQARGQ